MPKNKLKNGRLPSNNNDPTTKDMHNEIDKNLGDIVRMVEEHNETMRAKASYIKNPVKPSSSTSEVEVVVYNNPAKRKRKVEEESKDLKESRGPNAHISMKQIRHDIRRFAINNTKGQEREEAMQKYLIELGAKPPKKQFHNYKDFTKMRIKAKQEEAEQLQLNKETGEPIKKRRRPERTKAQNDVGLHAAQVGTFRHGVLKLNKWDIKKIMTTKVTR